MKLTVCILADCRCATVQPSAPVIRQLTTAFFASDDSAFVTGQTLNVDGGIVFS